jgi:hypothetical protein
MHKVIQASKKIVPLEKDIQRAMCEYLAYNKFFFWRVNNFTIFDTGKKAFRKLPPYTPKGISDLVLLHKGIFVAIEVKRPGIPLRPEQQVFSAQVARNGGLYWTVHSVEELQNNIETLL